MSNDSFNWKAEKENQSKVRNCSTHEFTFESFEFLRCTGEMHLCSMYVCMYVCMAVYV